MDTVDIIEVATGKIYNVELLGITNNQVIIPGTYGFCLETECAGYENCERSSGLKLTDESLKKNVEN